MAAGRGRHKRYAGFHKREKAMKINRYFWVVFIYFFINPLGLPWGLTYMALLTPLFYYWLLVTRKKDVLMPFVAALVPFAIVHLSSGVVLPKYMISVLNMMTVYIFCQVVYTFLHRCQNPEKVFWRILVWNFIFCLLAIPFYFYTPAKDFIWISQDFTVGVSDFKRFRGFTYEASYYATLFAPFFLFFYFQLILKQNKIKPWLLSAMLIVPFLFSLSLGVIFALVMACALTWLIHFPSLTPKPRVMRGLVLVPVLLIGGFLMTEIFSPNNALFLRIDNVLEGRDISKNARTSDAFMLTSKILEKREPMWGIGEGQLKVLGTNVIMNHYGYGPEFDKSLISIPNTTAETLLTFGWIGICIRFLAEIALFWHTRVWRNYYRLTLFLFIFIYQFTGSFLTSTAEYVAWILAFTDVFPQFDVRAAPSDALPPVVPSPL
jgi:hypothetical protein